MHGGSKRAAGNEKLRADDIHLRVPMEYVNDAGVIQLAVGFQQRDQHGILAALLDSITVKLLQKIFVPVLGGTTVGFVFHLKHDRDDFAAGLFRVAKDVVALAAGSGVVVFFKIRPREGRRADTVELGLAVLFKRLADHLRRQARLHVSQAFDCCVAVSNLRFVFVRQCFLGELLFEFRALQIALNAVTFALDCAHRLVDGKLVLDLGGIKLAATCPSC